MTTVGFIGLGNMGGAVARDLQRAGFALVVHDLRPPAAKTLLEHGAAWADTPAAVIHQAEVVVTMVFGPKQIEQVVRGDMIMFVGGTDPAIALARRSVFL